MDISKYTVVIQICNTLILFLVLRHILFKPVTEFLNKRQAAIKNAIDKADADVKEAAKLKADYELKLKEAREEARGIIENATKQGQKRQDEIVREARVDAERIKARAEADVEMQQDQALTYLRDQVADMAISAASKVIDQEFDTESQKRLVNRFIEGMGGSHEE
ncbi:F0F1 ATP synthase subunit B [Clostridium sp. 'deep sea']|uniref:F0F1 ATP synthase subunit B n=1 Tax=Clostridium sp. 'deep sea' TaxID=2779445 RepID=UPI001896486C|nr:F0F1 ATP synthase subunit B [Clostridium sp. 'deep sea']QOR33782.1 F0F1 ATP synthase subunit B [Clostridium sp. 'deep sea']